MKARRVILRDETADFDAFYSSGFDVVYRAAYAFSNSPDIASEAAQEAFVRAFARWRRLRRQPWAMGWVMTTALNVARNLLKKHSQDVRRQSPNDHAPHDATIDRIDLVVALSALPHRQKQAVVLHYIGGYQLHEVADLMSLSVGTVKSHLFKARAALREQGQRTKPPEGETR